MENIVKLFIDLVSIKSPSGQEKTIGAFIKKYLKSRVDELYEDSSGNIYAKRGGYGSPILLCAHMDTVQPAGSYVPLIKKGVLHANGKYVLGADDKSAVAVILDILNDLRREPGHRSIEILITVREETDGGLRSFPRKKIKAKEALLADIARPIGSVVTAAPYVGGYGISVSAPGNHVGLTTTSTVHPLRFLEEFMTQMKYGRVREDSIHNIAIVNMGESYNTVSQSLKFTGELRTFSKSYNNSFFNKLQHIVKKIDTKVGTRSRISLYPYCMGYILKKTDLRRIQNVYSRLSVKPNPISVFSVGDFNILKEWGITPINIGTGGKDAHTTYESISIQSLIRLKNIFLEYVR